MKRKELEKELKQLPREWLVAFAARLSSMYLPNLIEINDPDELYFYYWSKEKKANYLLVVLRANMLAYAFSFFSAPDAVYDFASDSAFDVNDADTDTFPPLSCALAALSSSVVVSNSSVSDVAMAAMHLPYFFDIEKKIYLLKKLYSENKKLEQFLLQPLWSPKDDWYQRSQEFVHVLRDYGSGFDLWADWYEGCLEGEKPNIELIKAVASLSKEQLVQESAQINAYLKSLSHTEGALNRVRVIFLGYGEAGKTSLIRALNGLEVDEGKERMTPGIDITTWKVPETEITAHFWDFGGQVMAHATHQFFLRSQCLYILLLDGRTEINANEQAEYWLEHVRAFGSKAPVMLVGNKADVCAVNLDMARLKEKHPNVTEFYPLSCTCYKDKYAAHFQRFRNDLISRIKQVGIHQIRFLKPHFTVLEELVSRSGQNSFLQKTAYDRLCAENGVAEQGDLDQGWLLDLLDKLGVVLHFPEIASLDSLILNPRWLTYGVYTLLYAKETEARKGRIKEGDIIRILGQKKVEDNLGNTLSYPPDKAGVIIQAMEHFKVCFRCRHETDLIIIPTRLESDQPTHGFNKADSLVFEFVFSGFLPRHVMPNFIVGRHDEIVKELVWQNGVVLQQQDGDAEALAQVDYHDRVLSLWVRGPQASRYFHTLHDEICRILRRMPDLPFEERVIVPESSRIGEIAVGARLSERPIRANFRQLLAMEARGRKEYDCEYGTFDLQQILGIMPAPDRENYRQTMFRSEINVRVDPRIVLPENNDPKPLLEEPKPVPQPKKLKFYQQWWFYTVAAGLVFGLGAWIYFRNIYVGGIFFLLASVLVFRLDPKRRFRSAAWTFAIGLLGVNVLPYIKSDIDLSPYVGTTAHLLFKLDYSQTPAVTIALSLLSITLFILDYLENKDRSSA